MHTALATPVRSTATSRASGWTKAARVIVDWSQETSSDSVGAEMKIDHLREWVRTYSQRAAVHVVLRRSLHQAHDRRLQSRLQSLGWQVTMRSRQTPVAA